MHDTVNAVIRYCATPRSFFSDAYLSHHSDKAFKWSH